MNNSTEHTFSGYEEDDMTLTNEEIEDAYNRLKFGAKLNIESGDHELMNRENYEKECRQWEKDTESIETALEMAKGDGWMSIDTAPKDGSSFLIFDYGDEWKECWWSGNEDVGWTTYQQEEYLIPTLSPKHWFSLPPQPPKSEG